MFTGFNFGLEYTSFALRQLTPFFLVMLVAAIIGCGPIKGIGEKLKDVQEKDIRGEEITSGQRKVQIVLYALAMLLLCWCILRLSGGSYNPFIYFRF